jgi:non-heme chloroperoxidase
MTTIAEREEQQVERANAEIPNRGRALTLDSGWREVAQTALAFVQRFA